MLIIGPLYYKHSGQGCYMWSDEIIIFSYASNIFIELKNIELLGSKIKCSNTVYILLRCWMCLIGFVFKVFLVTHDVLQAYKVLCPLQSPHLTSPHHLHLFWLCKLVCLLYCVLHFWVTYSVVFQIFSVWSHQSCMSLCLHQALWWSL